MDEGFVAHLWGIDAPTLVGNEDRIHACLPLFRIEGDSARIHVARKASWSLGETSQGLAVLTEDEAREFCHPLTLTGAPYRVHAGEMVAVVGPRYLESLERAVPALAGELRQSAWRSIEDGFRICLLAAGPYQTLRGRLFEQAKTRFDEEVRASWRSGLSDRAHAALAVLRNTTHGDPDAVLFRSLVGHRLARNADAYVQELTLGAVDMECATSELESRTDAFFKALVGAPPYQAEPQPRLPPEIHRPQYAASRQPESDPLPPASSIVVEAPLAGGEETEIARPPAGVQPWVQGLMQSKPRA